MDRNQQMRRNPGQNVTAGMLSDAPGQPVVIGQRLCSPQPPDNSTDQQRHNEQAAPIDPQPLWSRTRKMSIEKPERYQRMCIDQTQAEQFRSQPIERD